jgi:predicted DNA-binding transcriptional regulator YafY
MILKVADNDELIRWILSFGGQVRVAQPEALGQKVREEAKKVPVRAPDQSTESQLCPGTRKA